MSNVPLPPPVGSVKFATGGRVLIPKAGFAPDETNRFTVLLLATLPLGTVVLLWRVTVPTCRFAFVIAVVAAACVCPTTLGTVVGAAGPDDTTRSTLLAGITAAPADGF